MSDINDENLPSIEDYSDSSDDLPSVSDFLTEEELPSIEDYIKEESGGSVEEDKITIDDAEGNAFIEVTDVVKAPEWSELVRLVNNVRESIPDIPEIKYYDKELLTVVGPLDSFSSFTSLSFFCRSINLSVASLTDLISCPATSYALGISLS